jgi:hypothetical protein
MKYNGTDPLEKGTRLGVGRFGQYTLEVVEDKGDLVTVINQTKNYRKDPYDIDKSQLKNSIIKSK